MQAKPFVLLDDSLGPGGTSYYYENPSQIVLCERSEDVPASLERIQQALQNGYHAAGFFSYELGYLFEPKLTPLLQEQRSQPLLWVGIFDDRQLLTEEQVFDFVNTRAKDGDARSIEDVNLSMNKEAYVAAFRRAQDYIAAGDVYQINLTLKLLFKHKGTPFALYRELRRKQKVSYGGFIGAQDFHILSLSPELFFQVKDGVISARPMKGTAPRGLTPEADKKLKTWLQTDEKSRAENLMIVDLLRNDLGRLAKIGSVKVTDLFTVEDYRTVLQMTSGITAELQTGQTLIDILTAIFPCGSVTGAPKVRAMEIIRELETAPRGVYTGALGYLTPDKKAAFNVGIRTLLLKNDGNGEMGIGSGVVSDSQAEAEFDECLLKSKFLTEPYPAFQLIETMRYEQASGYYLLDRHLTRLQRSASHFGFQFNKDEIQNALKAEAENLSTPVHMVRLLLDERGTITTSNIAIELPLPETVWHFALSEKPVDQDDISFYHKTTKRQLYTEEFDRFHDKYNTDDVIFLNKRGELTEGSRTNIFLEKNGQLFTPAIKCGLLAGTLREELLEDKQKNIKETVLYLEDLKSADHVYLGNSVRGLVKSKWINLS